MYLCHTSCDELNAGTLEAYLSTVKDWLDRNRYEVITILLGNEDFVDPGKLVPDARSQEGSIFPAFCLCTEPPGTG